MRRRRLKRSRPFDRFRTGGPELTTETRRFRRGTQRRGEPSLCTSAKSPCLCGEPEPGVGRLSPFSCYFAALCLCLLMIQRIVAAEHCLLISSHQSPPRIFPQSPSKERKQNHKSLQKGFCHAFIDRHIQTQCWDNFHEQSKSSAREPGGGLQKRAPPQIPRI
jgi:hypothetical protein